MEWTPDQLARVLRMREDGISYNSIANVFGVSKSAAVSAGQRAGAPATKPAVHKRSPELDAAIRDQIRKGATNRQLRALFPVLKRFDHIRAEMGIGSPVFRCLKPVPADTSVSKGGHRPAGPKRVEADKYPDDGECCRSFGHVWEAGFRFCRRPTKPRRPFCEECESVVYETPRHKIEALMEPAYDR